MVDQHVRRLDDDLEKYERELAAAQAEGAASASELAKPVRKTSKRVYPRGLLYHTLAPAAPHQSSAKAVPARARRDH